MNYLQKQKNIYWLSSCAKLKPALYYLVDLLHKHLINIFLPFIYRQKTEALENLSNLLKFTHRMQHDTNSGAKPPEFKSQRCHY
jgi:hypothetical protein